MASRGRPPTTSSAILNFLSEGDGAWVGRTEMEDALPITERALGSALCRLMTQGKLERMEDKWRGNGSVEVWDETVWYRPRRSQTSRTRHFYNPEEIK